MKKLLYIAVFITFLVLNCDCSRHRSGIDRVLDSADNLMPTYPDSALKILKQVEGFSLKASDKARYALLLTKAQNKCNVFIGSDSIIKIAYDYYNNSGDSLEMQSAYYYGKIQHENMHHMGEALVALRRAFIIATSNHSHLFAGLSAMSIARIYGILHKSGEEYKWADIAVRNFIKIDQFKLAHWAEISISKSLITNGKLNKAADVLEYVDKETYETEPKYRHIALKIKADIEKAQKRYDSSNVILSILYNDDYLFNCIDWCKVSENNYHLNNFTKASQALDSAKIRITDTYDQLYCDYLSAILLNRQGNYKDASDIAIKWGENLEKEFNSQLNEDATSLLEEYLTKDAENARERAEIHKFRAVTSIIILLLVIAVAFVLVNTLRIKNQRDKERVKNLRSDISRLKTELNSIRSNHSKSSKNTIEYIRSLDTIYENGFRYLTSKQIINKLPKDVREVLEEIRNEENVNIINNCMDSICEEWIVKFTEAFPCLEQFQYQLAKYLHLNLSSEMIALLMKRDSLNAVYNLKSRLKKRLKADNPEAAEHYIREIFSKREIKNLSEFKAREEEQREKEENGRERHDETAHGAGGKRKPETFHGVAYEEGDKS